MSSISIGIAGAGGGAATDVNIVVSTSEGTITTNSTIGAVTIPAGALWVEIANAGMVRAGDQAVRATIQGADWDLGRKERWNAVWDVNAQDFIKLPEITINGNGARVFYTYFV